MPHNSQQGLAALSRTLCALCALTWSIAGAVVALLSRHAPKHQAGPAVHNPTSAS